jgi:hypothetical protein
MHPLVFSLCLGLLGLWLLLSAPVSAEERAEKRDRWQHRRAAWAACKAHRQAWRRRVFGSHPVLSGALFWASPVIFPALVTLGR